MDELLSLMLNRVKRILSSIIWGQMLHQIEVSHWAGYWEHKAAQDLASAFQGLTVLGEQHTEAITTQSSRLYTGAKEAALGKWGTGVQDSFTEQSTLNWAFKEEK